MLVVFTTCTFVYLICYFSPCKEIPDSASYLIDSSSHDSNGDELHTEIVILAIFQFIII